MKKQTKFKAYLLNNIIIAIIFIVIGLSLQTKALQNNAALSTDSIQRKDNQYNKKMNEQSKKLENINQQTDSLNYKWDAIEKAIKEKQKPK